MLNTKLARFNANVNTKLQEIMQKGKIIPKSKLSQRLKALIRALREDKKRRREKFTQADFARGIGVHRNTITSWLKGLTEPKQVEIILICDKHNVNLAYLLRGEEPMFNPSKALEIADLKLHLKAGQAVRRGCEKFNIMDSISGKDFLFMEDYIYKDYLLQPEMSDELADQRVENLIVSQ